MATGLGTRVTLLETAPFPLARAGEDIGRVLARVHLDHGVDRRTGTRGHRGRPRRSTAGRRHRNRGRDSTGGHRLSARGRLISRRSTATS
ncbi:hypothetical protein [Streptomyces sp. Mo3]|uniref:hypothetical protein n=1 Tax=Streptomyces sp. Mo3 TaxID=3161190 RepID=UPI0039EE88B7